MRSEPLIISRSAALLKSVTPNKRKNINSPAPLSVKKLREFKSKFQTLRASSNTKVAQRFLGSEASTSTKVTNESSTVNANLKSTSQETLQTGREEEANCNILCHTTTENDTALQKSQGNVDSSLLQASPVNAPVLSSSEAAQNNVSIIVGCALENQ